MDAAPRSVTFTSRREYLAWLFEHGEVIRVLGVERGPDPDAYRLTVTFAEAAPPVGLRVPQPGDAPA